MIPTLEGFVTARGGRRIAYSVAGPRDGVPVVYLHGGIGTPMRCAPELGEVINRLGIRHVSISRPGFGGSDSAPGRRITDFPADLARVAAHLRLDDFALVGVSSGGPYALATACAFPERVLALGVVSCVSPFGAPHESPAMRAHVKLALRTLVERPGLVSRTAAQIVGLIERCPRAAMRLALLCASHEDRRALGAARSLDSAMSAFLHHASVGVDGMLDDYALCCRPWGFDVREIEREVQLWHGAGDDFVPLEHARSLAAALPNCRPHIGSDDGHFFYRRRMATVLEVLVAGARRQLDRASLDPTVTRAPSPFARSHRPSPERLPAAA